MSSTVTRRTNLRAKELRRNQTDAERILWQKLRARQLGGFKFRRQVPVGPYYADFSCLEAKVIVEVDGGQHNEAKDAARTEALEKAGYRIVRFWNNEVIENIDGVRVRLLEILTELK